MPKISPAANESGSSAIAEIYRDARDASGQQHRFAHWFEAAAQSVYEPLLGGKPKVVTDPFICNDELPIDIIVTVTSWGFEATQEQLDELCDGMQAKLEKHFEGHDITVKVFLNYIPT